MFFIGLIVGMMVGGTIAITLYALVLAGKEID